MSKLFETFGYDVRLIQSRYPSLCEVTVESHDERIVVMTFDFTDDDDAVLFKLKHG